VQNYRIFVFDKENHFAGVELATYQTDDDALARAAELVTDQLGVEVWARGRIVGTLAPRERAHAAGAAGR
jgi:hypothetical protein